MDTALAMLGSLAAAMALETAPTPDVDPATPSDAPCEEARPADGKRARPACKPDPNAVDGITVESKRGARETPIEPDEVFDEAAIKSFGAATVGELMTAMGPMLRSSRGRGGDEPPVLLINGQRTSGFQETANIPTEAIVSMARLKEEAALAYGYRADQTVLDLTLKKNFRARTVRTDGWRSTAGGRAGTEQRLGIFKVDPVGRLTGEIRYRRESPLYEDERGVVRAALDGASYDLQGNVVAPSGEIDPALSALVGGPIATARVPVSATTGRPLLSDFAAGAGRLADDDLTASRSLTPRQEEGAIQAAYTRNFDKTTATLSGSLERAGRVSYRGLTGAAIPIAAGGPFSPFANDVILYRYLGGRDALRGRTDTDKLNAGVLLLGLWSGWRWTFAGNLDQTDTATRIGRGVDVLAFRAAVAAGDPAVNPFGPVAAALLSPLPLDTADSRVTNLKADITLAGTVAQLPAGRLRATFKAGADRRRIDSESVRSGISAARLLTRDRVTLSSNIDVPLVSRDDGPLKALGKVSLNGNLLYERFSDLGGLVTAGGGLSWSPVKRLTLSANYSAEEGEPALERLNDPVVQTPNVPMYDFASGTSVIVTQTSGGNPGLTSDSRRLVKLGLNYKPFEKRELTLIANYVASRIDDQVASLPGVSPELEAAFPGRFTRDAAGRLIAVDARPVNFAYEDKQELTWGLSYYRRLGKPPAPGKGGSTPFGTKQGYLRVSLDHVWRLKDEVVIRRGMAPLDLLDGASLGRRGGTPRHEVTLMGNAYNNGVGLFTRATWKASTFVDGGALGQDLKFSALPLFYAQGFVDLGERPVAKGRPWLNGVRLTASLENVFDTHQRVRDEDGRTPQAYQPAYMDPLGRTVRMGLIKRF
jgi:hypothetical protein